MKIKHSSALAGARDRRTTQKTGCPFNRVGIQVENHGT